MKQHIETAAIAAGLGVLAYVAYRTLKQPNTRRNYTDASTYYAGDGTISNAGILDPRDAMANHPLSTRA